MIGVNIQVEESGLATVTVDPHFDPWPRAAKRCCCCVCSDKLAFANTYLTCGACYQAGITATRAREAGSAVRADDGQGAVRADDGQGPVSLEATPLASTN